MFRPEFLGPFSHYWLSRGHTVTLRIINIEIVSSSTVQINECFMYLLYHYNYIVFHLGCSVQRFYMYFSKQINVSMREKPETSRLESTFSLDSMKM